MFDAMLPEARMRALPLIVMRVLPPVMWLALLFGPGLSGHAIAEETNTDRPSSDSLPRIVEAQALPASKPATLKGDTGCRHGDAHCNRCASDVRGQFSGVSMSGLFSGDQGESRASIKMRV